MRIHHIGYAVRNMDESLDAFKAIGYVVEGGLTDDIMRKVRIVFIKNGNNRVELVTPLCEGSPVDSVLSKSGNVPYHICYAVDSIQNTYTNLKKDGFIMLHKPLAAPALDLKNVAFLYSKAVGLIELLEDSENITI